MSLSGAETATSIHSIVCTAFRNLADFCSERIITNRNPNQATPSIDHINTQRALLTDMQTRLLPSLIQHLEALLVSQDLFRSVETPQPNLQATLEILSQLKETVTQIKSSFVSIRQAAQVPESEDGQYGCLKRHRLGAIMVKIHYTLRYPVTLVLEDHLAFLERWKDSEKEEKMRIQQSLYRDNAAVFHFVQIITHAFHESELSILQAVWQAASYGLEHSIEYLTDQINANLDRSNEHRAENDRAELSRQPHLDDRPAQLGPSGDTDGHQHDQQHANYVLASPNSVIDHQQSANVLPSANSAVDHRPRQSTNVLRNRAPQEEISMKPYVVKLAQSVLPLVKLSKLLLNKLCLAPSYQAPFTIEDQMSSTQFNSLRNDTADFFSDLHEMVAILVEVCRDFRASRASIVDVEHQLQRSLLTFDRCMDALRLRLVPCSPANHFQQPSTPLPEAEKHRLNQWFALFIDQVRLAAQNFRVEMGIFERKIMNPSSEY
ncbi:hypothetical protein PGTUg99_022351 [Puccinia graminis f. sp. tritici]|uniref:Uncharacterized protein n=1 Tax=Puccinia graminis f. sp. tritici TaxID=56615 RepID=A0A5B0RE02_PUCGR|nr:hypothetical protein PGTUg99_022351 [Puccinia graminis f. sp. tritici]